MATITSNGTGGGLWSAGATWVGGVAPVDNDTVVIASGDTVTFNVDTSAWANGINGLTITGTLKVSTSTSSYMKMKASTVIVGAGTFNIGESGAGAIPFAVKHTLTGGAGWYIDGNAGLTMTVYGAEPSIKYVKLSGDEAIGQTELSVDTDITGDIWADGDTITISDINKGKEVEERVIATGGRASGTITVTAGLTAAKSTGAVICLVTRNIKIISVGTGTRTIYRVGNTDNKLTIGSGMFYGVSEVLFDTCHFSNISGGTFSVHNVVYTSCNSINITGGVFTNNNFCIANGSISTMSNGNFIGNGTCYSGQNFATVTGGWFSGNTTIFNAQSHTSVSGGTFENCQHITGPTLNSSIFQGVTFTNMLLAINSGTAIMLINCSMVGCDTDIYSQTGVGFNNVFGVGTEHGDYTAISNYMNYQSYNHDGNAGAFKAWSKGGVVTSQTSTKPTGYVQAYTHALESATYPCFWYKTFTVAAGEEVSVEVQLRKTASMAYLPRVYLMNSIENPIADPTQAEDSFTMTDSTDTWESDTFTIDNSAGTTDKDYTLYFVGKNATGSVYSAVDITTQGGGTSSVKILPFTGKVGL